MSVPLPSPSAPVHSTSKPIKGRPAAIPSRDRDAADNGGAAGLGRSPGTASGSLRRPSRSGGLSGSPAEGNWRDRNAGPNGASAGALGSAKAKGPERTVGGFDKRPSGGSPTEPPARKVGEKEKDKDKDKDKDKEEKAASLSHVPCRFFKAGTCTAGANCVFSHDEGGKKEVCQWFLKGNCRFGHKCALAHIRPGETMVMDRKNKKAAQLEAKESKGDKPAKGLEREPRDAREGASAAPVPIRSALSSSLQGAGAGAPARVSSSPMREPFGPPANLAAGSPSAAGFGRSPGAFGASPNRPSPLSASFSARLAVPSALSLKGNPTTAPATAGVFSSSFSHPSLLDQPRGPPLSASFADGAGSGFKRSIWARSETPGENLSPRRAQALRPGGFHADVFEDDDEGGEDLLPSSLSDLLTPREMARRLSRHDSSESAARIAPYNGERLAQSAGAAMGAGFLGSLWSADGNDARKLQPQPQPQTRVPDLAFGDSAPAPPRQSLLSQRAPVSPLRHTTAQEDGSSGNASADNLPELGAGLHMGMGFGGERRGISPAPAYFTRTTDPSSPSARALQEHAPGQSLPGGVATALSRLHLRDRSPGPVRAHGQGLAVGRSGLAQGQGQGQGQGRVDEDARESERERHADGEEGEEGMFAMDG